MDTHLDPLLHRPHHRTNSWVYLVLGIVLVTSFVWQGYGSEVVRKWHPFYDVEYSLYWYLALTSMSLRPLLYCVVAILAKRRHYGLIKIFIIYEAIIFFDHILIYSQSPVREPIAILLATYMIWYHYKYEHVGEIF